MHTSDEESHFHGFSDDIKLPDPLVLVTSGEGDSEELVKVVRKKRKGRPQGVKNPPLYDEDMILSSSRRPECPPPPPRPPSSSPCLPTTPKVLGGTSSRVKVFLLDQLSESIPVNKLPKTSDVLRALLFYKNTGLDMKTSLKKTGEKIKQSWKHHFGTKVIYGKNFEEELISDKSAIIIVPDNQIREKLSLLLKEYNTLELTSRRPDRAKRAKFTSDLQKFKDKLETPFKIQRKNYEEIFRQKSGITFWAEDVMHLKLQMQNDQPSSVDSWDLRQQKKNDRQFLDKVRADKRAEKIEVKEKLYFDNNNVMSEENVEGVLDGEPDGDFSSVSPKKKKKFIDVMGPISLTADRIGLSIRDRALIAASVVNSIGLDIQVRKH